MNAIPGFFASMFGELLLDKDCDSIEVDPNADPVEKEICRTFRQFNESIRSFVFEPHVESDDYPDIDSDSSSTESSDPQSLKDSILQRPEQMEPEPPRRYSPFPRRPPQDKDLDKLVEADPSLLEQYLHGEESPRSHIHRGEEGPGPHVHSHSSYSSVIITRRPDGSYEERRTVRDSEGNEEVTVTRSDGQQTHTETHRTDKDGTSSKSEAEWERSRIMRQGDSDNYLDRLRDWFWPRKS